jgi:hypothetical protein
MATVSSFVVQTFEQVFHFSHEFLKQTAVEWETFKLNFGDCRIEQVTFKNDF